MVKPKGDFLDPGLPLVDDFGLQNLSFEKSRSQLSDALRIHGGGGSTGMLKRLRPDSQLHSFYRRLRGEQTLKTC